MVAYFGFRPILGSEARALAITIVDGIEVGANDEIFPYAHVCPMGWSWAFFFVQALHEQFLQEATGIPRERCERIGLGYLDPSTVDIESWADRETEDVLLVRRAGEMLYRVRGEA